jgi:hypothetical protein
MSKLKAMWYILVSKRHIVITNDRVLIRKSDSNEVAAAISLLKSIDRQLKSTHGTRTPIFG